MSKPKLTSLLFLGFIGRIAETLTHDRIINLVESNAELIRQRMNKAA